MDAWAAQQRLPHQCDFAVIISTSRPTDTAWLNVSLGIRKRKGLGGNRTLQFLSYFCYSKIKSVSVSECRPDSWISKSVLSTATDVVLEKCQQIPKNPC